MSNPTRERIEAEIDALRAESTSLVGTYLFGQHVQRRDRREAWAARLDGLGRFERGAIPGGTFRAIP